MTQTICSFVGNIKSTSFRPCLESLGYRCSFENAARCYETEKDLSMVTVSGYMFMSLIHTCELNKVNPFDYLTQLQKHIDAATVSPADWMPWNHRDKLQSTGTPE